MNNQENAFIGCFVSTTKLSFDSLPNEIDYGAVFREYLWGKNGLANYFKVLGRGQYGDDIQFVLIKYFVNPSDYQLPYIKEISDYSKKERSITLSIIVNSVNFFSRDEHDRLIFLKETLFGGLLVLKAFSEKKKLDLNIQFLVADLTKALVNF